ncbi:MAG: DUF411 domain-containing protein [Acidobacteria bacterium]|nr:DUF411 domain-containing protein [Acidobacteriota bacterium]
MKSYVVTGVLALLLGAAVISAQRPAPTMEVYKSPTCGCCSKWVEHVRAGGITVNVTDLSDGELDALKQKHGIPGTAQSCHTGVVGGYVVEGHVPVSDVLRMLKERPAVAGIAVGGMPLGSPGMEVPGRKPHMYNVVTFDKQGALKVYSTQNKQ